jgi:hypothetical protein
LQSYPEWRIADDVTDFYRRWWPWSCSVAEVIKNDTLLGDLAHSPALANTFSLLAGHEQTINAKIHTWPGILLAKLLFIDPKPDADDLG